MSTTQEPFAVRLAEYYQDKLCIQNERIRALHKALHQFASVGENNMARIIEYDERLARELEALEFPKLEAPL